MFTNCHTLSICENVEDLLTFHEISGLEQDRKLKSGTYTHLTHINTML